MFVDFALRRAVANTTFHVEMFYFRSHVTVQLV